MTAAMHPSQHSPHPSLVFILGIQRRSGTNFLSDLLSLHPQCEKVRTIWEDFFLANVDKLDGFVHGVSQYWNPKWDADGRAARQLGEYLGAACVQFLLEKAHEVVGTLPRYVVTKTPSVRHLERLSFFPQTKAIVIVRDGRSVVASGIRSFGWDFETAIHEWAAAAETVLSAQQQDIPFLLVRYEDLVRDLPSEMNRIFSYLDIDSAQYNLDAARQLPVRGSSETKTNDGEMNWRPVEKTADFTPLARWASWTSEQQEQFNSIAGGLNVSFGYR